MDNSSDAVTSDNSQAVKDDNIEEQPADPELVGALSALFHTDEPHSILRELAALVLNLLQTATIITT